MVHLTFCERDVAAVGAGDAKEAKTGGGAWLYRSVEAISSWLDGAPLGLNVGS